MQTCPFIIGHDHVYQLFAKWIILTRFSLLAICPIYHAYSSSFSFSCFSTYLKWEIKKILIDLKQDTVLQNLQDKKLSQKQCILTNQWSFNTVLKNVKFSIITKKIRQINSLVKRYFHEIFAKKVWERISTLCARVFLYEFAE